MADVDWQAVRLAYVRGSGSYKALAEEYGISLNTLSKRAKREGWAKERRRYAASVARKAQARAMGNDIKRLAALQNAGTQMCDQIEAIMQDAKSELHKHVDMYGNVHEIEAVDARKLLNLSKAIETMTKAMTRLYDIQTGAERTQLELARQEMALKEREQARKDRAAEEGNQAQEIRITYHGQADLEAYHD